MSKRYSPSLTVTTLMLAIIGDSVGAEDMYHFISGADAKKIGEKNESLTKYYFGTDSKLFRYYVDFDTDCGLGNTPRGTYPKTPVELKQSLHMLKERMDGYQQVLTALNKDSVSAGSRMQALFDIYEQAGELLDGTEPLARKKVHYAKLMARAEAISKQLADEAHVDYAGGCGD